MRGCYLLFAKYPVINIRHEALSAAWQARRRPSRSRQVLRSIVSLLFNLLTCFRIPFMLKFGLFFTTETPGHGEIIEPFLRSAFDQRLGRLSDLVLKTFPLLVYKGRK